MSAQIPIKERPFPSNRARKLSSWLKRRTTYPPSKGTDQESGFISRSQCAIASNEVPICVGFELVDGVDLSAAYYRAFESEVSGPLYRPAYEMGQVGVPGTIVRRIG